MLQGMYNLDVRFGGIRHYPRNPTANRPQWLAFYRLYSHSVFRRSSAIALILYSCNKLVAFDSMHTSTREW